MSEYVKMSQANGSLQLPYSDCEQLLQEVLRDEDIRDAAVTVSAGSVNGQNFLGDIYRVAVAGKGADGAPRAARLVLKAAPRGAGLRRSMPVGTFYRRELFAYAELLPALCRLQADSGLPAAESFHYARLFRGRGEELEESLLLGDLAEDGFVMYDRQKPLDLEHARIAVSGIARYHALSFVLKAKRPEEFSALAARVAAKYELGSDFLDMISVSFRKLVDYAEDDAQRSVLAEVAEHVPQLYESMTDPEKTAPYNVLCHGDCWLGNLLYKYSNHEVVDVRFLDWQICRLASPVTDLAYLLFPGTDEDLKSQHFCRLLDLYYAELSLSIGRLGGRASELYPQEAYRRHVEQLLPYGVMIGSCGIPLLLTEAGEAPAMSACLENARRGRTEVPYTAAVVDRLRGLIRDSIKFNVFSNIITQLREKVFSITKQ